MRNLGQLNKSLVDGLYPVISMLLRRNHDRSKFVEADGLFKNLYFLRYNAPIYIFDSKSRCMRFNLNVAPPGKMNCKYSIHKRDLKKDGKCLFDYSKLSKERVY